MPTSTRPPSVARLCDALLTSSSALAAVMRQVTDPAAPAVGTWAIAETAAHVSRSADHFMPAARGEAGPERLDEVDAANAQALSDDPERDLRTLADRLECGERALVDHARQTDGDPLVRPFAGVEVPLSTLLGVELGELLVHGFDIAKAAGLPWHVDPQAALMTVQTYIPLLPYMLDTSRTGGVRLSLQIRVRGLTPVVVKISDDRLTLHEGHDGPVDAHVVAAPSDYLLLTWNRIPAWRSLVTGKLFVWGRRPWRATELAKLLLT